MPVTAEIKAADKFFRGHAGFVGAINVKDAKTWRVCAKASKNRQWVYLIDFAGTAYAFGTAKGKGERLVKSGLLQRKVIGKYDRRVDYLMLRKLHGAPTFTAYEFDIAATIPEQAWRMRLYGHVRRGTACLRGFASTDRDGIAREILEEFRQCAHYRAQRAHTALFEDFVQTVFLARRRHPKNRKRTFFYGDSLEPKFFTTIKRADLRPAVEAILDIEM